MTFSFTVMITKTLFVPFPMTEEPGARFGGKGIRNRF